MKTTESADVAFAKLKFIAKLAETHRGTISTLAERLTTRTGSKVHRQQIEGWLQPDKSKRIEPKLGIGLLLIEEANKIKDQNGGK